MPMLSADPSFKLLAICSCVLVLESLVLAGITPAKRAKHKGFINPEDNRVSFEIGCQVHRFAPVGGYMQPRRQA